MSNHPNQASYAVPTAMAAGSPRKKVNILAMGSSRSDFDSIQLMESRPDILQDAELWGINYMGAIKRLDRIIHVDPVHPYLGHPPVKDMCDWALKDGIPLYTSWPHPFYSNHVVYPFDKVVQTLGIHYLNGTVAAALALAMCEGFNEIGLFGADFSYPQAHLAESGRANVEFLIGMGSQRGIKFAIASTSTLLDMYCQQQPYGFFQNPLLPPNNGGKLMNVQQILEHCNKMRQEQKFARPHVFTIEPTAPQTVLPLTPVHPEHQTYTMPAEWFAKPAPGALADGSGQPQVPLTGVMPNAADTVHLPDGNR